MTSVQQQLDNFVEVVKQALGGDPDAFERMWVEPRELPNQGLLELLLPGITSADARSKRQAIKNKIGVPADRSLRAKKRAYAIRSNRSKFLGRMASDLARHTATTSNPVLKQDLQKATAIVQGAADAVASAVQNVATGLTGQVGNLLALSFNNTPPDDVGRLTEAVADAGLSQPDSKEVMITSEPKTVVAASTAGTTATPEVNVVLNYASAEPFTPATSMNITALFDRDFQDVRRTGIVMPLHALRQRIGENAGSLLSYIYLTDQDRNVIRPVQKKIVDGKETDVMVKAKLNGKDVQVPARSPMFTFSGSGSFGPDYYNHFMLTSLQESHMEKYQVADTLAEGWLAHAFGKAPQVWNLTGLLVNDVFSDQLTRFRELFDKNLRISVLAKTGRKMAVVVPAAGIVIYGYGLNLQINTDAQQNEALSTFSMPVLVAGWTNLPLINYVQQEPTLKALPQEITTEGGGVIAILDTKGKLVGSDVAGLDTGAAGLFRQAGIGPLGSDGQGLTESGVTTSSFKGPTLAKLIKNEPVRDAVKPMAPVAASGTKAVQAVNTSHTATAAQGRAETGRRLASGRRSSVVAAASTQPASTKPENVQRQPPPPPANFSVARGDLGRLGNLARLAGRCADEANSLNSLWSRNMLDFDADKKVFRQVEQGKRTIAGFVKTLDLYREHLRTAKAKAPAGTSDPRTLAGWDKELAGYVKLYQEADSKLRKIAAARNIPYN